MDVRYGNRKNHYLESSWESGKCPQSEVSSSMDRLLPRMSVHGSMTTEHETSQQLYAEVISLGSSLRKEAQIQTILLRELL